MSGTLTWIPWGSRISDIVLTSLREEGLPSSQSISFLLSPAKGTPYRFIALFKGVKGYFMCGRSALELEVVEEYVLLGERRFRIRVKGTNIYVNVAASSREEALSKALSMLEKLRADRVLKGLRGGES